MAQNKLTWQELRKAVADLALCSEKEADVFLNALISSVVEGLKTDKQVKIKGLGSFSLKAVAPRKSVNIATGEDFTIEGYNKLTFTAEATMKESVEKRIEKPATEEVINTIINDPIKKLEKQADEIVDILSELGQSPDNQEDAKPVTASKKTKKTEKTKKEKVAAKPKKVEEAKEVEKTNQVVVEAPKCTEKKCKCGWIFWVIGGVLLAGLIGTGIYYHEPIIGWVQCSKLMDRPIKSSEYHDMVLEKHSNTCSAKVDEKKSFAVCIGNIRDEVVKWLDALITNDESVELELEVEVQAPASTPIKKEITPLRPNKNRTNNVYEDLQYNNDPGIQTYQTKYDTEQGDVLANDRAEQRIKIVAGEPSKEELTATEVVEVEEKGEEVVEEATAIPSVEPVEEVATEKVDSTVAEEVVVLVETSVTVRDTVVGTVETTKEVVEIEQPSTAEVVVDEPAVISWVEQPRVYTEYLATEVVDKNSRLTLIAEKYYGHKDLWVFIYEANRGTINHPGKVKPGQEILVPALAPQYKDLSNPELRKLVNQLTQKYLK